MRFWRSWDGVVNLSWLCALVFVASVTDAALTDSELAARLAYGLAAVAIVALVLSLFWQKRLKRRAESKVTESAPILLADIRLLAKANSSRLEDAIARYNAQQEQAGAAGD